MDLDDAHVRAAMQTTLVLSPAGTAELNLTASYDSVSFTGTWVEDKDSDRDAVTLFLKESGTNNVSRFTLVCDDPEDEGSASCLVLYTNTDVVIVSRPEKWCNAVPRSGPSPCYAARSFLSNASSTSARTLPTSAGEGSGDGAAESGPSMLLRSMKFLSHAHASFWSQHTAPTRRSGDAVEGKTWTTEVRRLISRFILSWTDLYRLFGHAC